MAVSDKPSTLPTSAGSDWTFRAALLVNWLLGNAAHPVCEVADLPTAAAVGAGARGFVTDASATTFASVVAGGGANGVPVYSDGTNWRIG